MKTAIILTAFAILCIFAIAIFYPMYRSSVKKRKLQAWRDDLYKGDKAVTPYGVKCWLQTTPDVNGDCKILTYSGQFFYTNIDKLYPLEGGENGTIS